MGWNGHTHTLQHQGFGIEYEGAPSYCWFAWKLDNPSIELTGDADADDPYSAIENWWAEHQSEAERNAA